MVYCAAVAAEEAVAITVLRATATRLSRSQLAGRLRPLAPAGCAPMPFRYAAKLERPRRYTTPVSHRPQHHRRVTRVFIVYNR